MRAFENDMPLEEVVMCPVLDAPCNPDCPMWLRLEDWEGCLLEASPKWVAGLIRGAAQDLDKALGLTSRLKK